MNGLFRDGHNLEPNGAVGQRFDTRIQQCQTGRKKYIVDQKRIVFKIQVGYIGACATLTIPLLALFDWFALIRFVPSFILS
jgi:hypothetical protein